MYTDRKHAHTLSCFSLYPILGHPIGEQTPLIIIQSPTAVL